MKVTKMIPSYWVENFGIVSVDEQCSWIEEEKHYAICFVLDIPYKIKIEDDATFFYETIPNIEKEMKLAPGALTKALILYLAIANNTLEFEYI